jgi:Domain of unknown function (DUF4345)
MSRALRSLSALMGGTCVGIGLGHLALGVRSVPGEGGAGPTVDSRERFYGPVFASYGLAWVWAARQTPIPTPLIRFLASTLFVGGVGRVVSIADAGWPHWFQTALTGTEFALPAVFFQLAAAEDTRRS